MPSEYATIDPAPDPRPGPTGMSCFFCPLDIIHDNKEIPFELHLGDDIKFVVQTFFVVPR